MLEHRLVFGDAGVHMLGIRADLAAVPPLHVARDGLQRADERSQEGRLALAVVAHDRGPRPVDDLQIDAAGDGVVGIAHAEIAAPHRRPSAGRHGRALDRGGGGFGHHIFDLQPLELLGFRLRPRRGRGAGLVAGDEVFQLPPLREHGGIRSFDVRRLLPLILEKRVDTPRIDGQLAAGQVERLIARGPEEGSIVRDDQAGLAIAPQEVLEENLRPQVEEVGRLVEEEQVGLVKQQGRELHPRLPTARERRHRPGKHRPLDLELPRDLAALPVGLAAVPHQEVEGRLSGVERIVLPEITEPEPGMADDLPGIEFFVPENHPQ